MAQVTKISVAGSDGSVIKQVNNDTVLKKQIKEDNSSRELGLVHQTVSSDAASASSDSQKIPATVRADGPTNNNTNYAGDIIDDVPLLEEKYKVLPFANSAMLLATFDDNIRNQVKSIDNKPLCIWPWQKDISIEMCQPSVQPTAQHPLKYALVAANGSGKDAFVIAPFVIWFMLTKIRSRVIVTSSSGVQLTSQTENYIRNLAININEQLGVEVFRVRQRYIKCRWSGSEVRMFATDEAGKAEGYHPLDPNAEMAIIVNEGKSVTEEIHQALKRCSGYNYWIEVSSPGEPKGYLYDAFNNWKHTRRVTSYDCPHISEEERIEDRRLYGEHSAYYRSKHLALFTSLGGEVIVPLELVNKLLENPPQFTLRSTSKWVKRIGIDLSKGRDEIVFCITQGNKQIVEETWREFDTTITADKIHQLLIKHGIPKDYEYIFADDGGIGGAIIDMLVRKEWNIKRIHNQSPAIQKARFGNRGAQAWDIVKRLFEEGVWNPVGMSKQCIEQLTCRKTKERLDGAKVFLQSKAEAKSHGYKSPDRADAFILSLTGLTLDDFLDDLKPVDNTNAAKPLTVLKTAQDVEAYWREKEMYSAYNDSLNNAGKGPKLFGSLQTALGE